MSSEQLDQQITLLRLILEEQRTNSMILLRLMEKQDNNSDILFNKLIAIGNSIEDNLICLRTLCQIHSGVDPFQDQEEEFIP